VSRGSGVAGLAPWRAVSLGAWFAAPAAAGSRQQHEQRIPPCGRLTTPRSSAPIRQTGIYIDKKCPFTGNVSIRGRILSGEN
jgi:hypothetical protein